MQNVIKEITKEQYEEVKDLPRKEQLEKLLPNGIPMEWEYGYGFYGHSVYEKDDKYYASYTIGNSCD